jgi:hypothetical protein
VRDEPVLIIDRVLVLTSFALAACASFGRFKREFLLEIYAKIDQHIRDSARSTPNQLDHSAPVADNETSSETVVMSNNLPGGLLRPNKSSNSDEVAFFGN